MDCCTPGFPVHHQLLQFTQTHVHWVDDAIQPSYPPPAFNLSQHQRSQFFASGGQNIDVSALVLPVSIHGWLPLGLIDLISLQFKRLSILGYSAFFTVQLSHPYITTGKTIALTRWTFVGKLMSLLFNMLSMLVIAFLLRSKCLLISWLQSPSAVILEPKKIKSDTVSIFSPSFPWSDVTGSHDLSFLNVEF